jgi:hypothetical protein
MFSKYLVGAEVLVIKDSPYKEEVCVIYDIRESQGVTYFKIKNKAGVDRGRWRQEYLKIVKSAPMSAFEKFYDGEV